MKTFILSPPGILLIIIIVMSLVSFIAMGRDKRLAMAHRRRTPEARLFLYALLGGGIGGWAGMYAFRHKTKHLKFIIGFPLIALIQAGGLLYLVFK